MALSIGEIYATLKLRDEMSAALAAAKANMKGFGSDVATTAARMATGLVPALESVEKHLVSTGKSLQKTGSHISEAGAAMLPLSAAIGGLGYVAIDTFADFERGMNRVRAVTGETTGANIEALEKQAKMLGATTVYTAREAADAMGFFGLAGFKAHEIIGAMPGTLQLAAAGQMAVGDAANITAKIMRGYGLTAEETGRMNDVLVKSFTSANTDLVQLGEAFKHAGPVAHGAGVQFEETAALLSIMADAGFQASIGGTSLRNAVVRLLHPIGETKDAIKEIGLVTRGANGELLPMADIIQQLEEKGAKTEQVMRLFGMRGGPAMLAAVEKGSDALREFTKMLEESGGTAERIERIQLEGLRGKMILLQSAWEGALISMGESLSKFAGPAIDKLTEFAQTIQFEVVPWFEDLSPTAKNAIVGILAALAVGGPALMAFGATVRVIGFALEGVGMAVGTMAKGISAAMDFFRASTIVLSSYTASGTALGGMLSSVGSIASGAFASGLAAARTALAVLTGPVGLVVTGLTLLVGWFATTETGAKFFAAVWDQVADAMEPVGRIAKAVGAIIYDLGAIVLHGIVEVAKDVVRGVRDIAVGIQSLGVEGILMFLPHGEKFVAIWRWVKDALSEAYDWCVKTADGVASLGGKIIAFIPGGEQALQVLRWLKGGLSDIAGTFEEGADRVHTYAQSVGAVGMELPKVESPLKSLGTTMQDTTDYAYILSDEFTRQITPVRKLSDETGGLTEAQKEHLEAVKELVNQYNGSEVRNGLKLWADALPKIGDLTKRTTESQEEMRDTLGDLIDEARAMGIEVPPAVSKAYAALANNTTVRDALKQYTQDTREAATKIIEENYRQAREVGKIKDKEFTDTLDAAAKAYEALYQLKATDTEKAIREAARQRDGFLKEIEPLKKLAPDEYARAAAKIQQKYDDMVAQAKQGGKRVVGGFVQSLAGLPDVIMQAMTGGGNVMNSVLGHIGKSLFSEDNGLTKLLHGGISKLGTLIGGDFGANMVQSLSNVLPGIGAAIGPALGALGSKLLGSLFGSAGRDKVKEFAATFEGGFDGLREKLNSLGDKGEMLWRNLTQGVGKNNPEQAQKAIDAINKAFAEQEAHLQAVEDAMSRYNVSWQNLEGEARARGLADAVKKLTSDTELLKEAGLSVEGALRAQADAYNELILESARAGEEMPLDLLKVAREMASLGLLTEETMRALLDGADATMPKWEDMEAAANKYGIELSSLGDKFKQAKLGDLLNEYASDFELLVRGGADAAAVAAGMADEVNEALADALKYGLEVPASMRPLLQALADSGELLDENGETMKDLSRVKFGETLAESTDRLIAKLDELIEKLTGGVGGAVGQLIGDLGSLQDLEFNIHLNPVVGENGEGIAARAVAMARGGVYRVDEPTLFIAGEDGPETVFGSGGYDRFGTPEEVFGGRSMPPLNLNLLIENNGNSRQLTDAEFKQMERAMATGAVRVSRRAIGERVQ